MPNERTPSEALTANSDNGKPDESLHREINIWGKWAAGFFFTVFTIAPALIIVAYWPDRLPSSQEFIKPLYNNKAFHVQLAGVYDSTAIYNSNILYHRMHGSEDSAVKAAIRAPLPVLSTASENGYIHINTLLLILVAAGGFLGNMIHVATSFTTYVGADKFKRSWVLWYWIKPFSASALAIGFYFVFRGGFLNMSDDTSNINIYGVMTISILSGLFTETATKKLKEVFDVLFKPKEELPDKLESKVAITNSNTETLDTDKINTILLTGKDLKSETIIVKIEDVAVQVTDMKDDALTFTYQVPQSLKDKEFVTLVVFNAAGKDIYRRQLRLNKVTPQENVVPVTNTDEKEKDII